MQLQFEAATSPLLGPTAGAQVSASAWRVARSASMVKNTVVRRLGSRTPGASAGGRNV